VSQPDENQALPERLAIIGTGTIACGLARVAAQSADVTLWARSAESANRVRSKLDESVTVVTDLSALGDRTFCVEAVVEEYAAKAEILGQLDGVVADATVVSSTTSSLGVGDLAWASGRPDRFAALHVFNPVDKMPLCELSFPEAASESTRGRARALCAALGKTSVEVPDFPGFVVNRLLFPYLFSAVRLLETTGVAPEQIDTCMTLGAGHPLGPLALIDFVGLDVAVAIGRELGETVPPTLTDLIAAGRLGKKTRAGFYDYPEKAKR
jgi:3-hydroxyacyl-CoA dehydrogenase